APRRASSQVRISARVASEGAAGAGGGVRSRMSRLYMLDQGGLSPTKMKVEGWLERKLEAELSALGQRNFLPVCSRRHARAPVIGEARAIGGDELPDQVESIVLPVHLQ